MPIIDTPTQPKPMAMIIEELIAEARHPALPRPEGAPERPGDITAENQTAALLKGRGLGNRGDHKMGASWLNIEKYLLHLDFGYPTLAEYVQQVLNNEPNLSTLKQHAAVAERFNEDDAAELTCHRLYHLLSYAKKKGITDLTNPGDIVIEVPELGKDGATKWVKKPVRKCATTEIEAALKYISTPEDVLKEGDEAAQNLQQAIRNIFGEDTFVKVETVRRPRGFVIRIDNLDADQADRLRELLSRP